MSSKNEGAITSELLVAGYERALNTGMGEPQQQTISMEELEALQALAPETLKGVAPETGTQPLLSAYILHNS
jgi:uncharacterized protein YidB (DUF937 family)